MKKLNLILLSIVLAGTFACKTKKSDITDPNVNPAVVNQITLEGNLPTQTLDATKKYLIKGQVFVQSGSVLTIPAGTVLMGDKATKGALIINVGGQISAIGTAANPIVFTSAQAVGARDEGDWCGVILLGDAPVNQVSPTIEGITPAVTYGGTNATSNSGTMKYCRIEFAGIALTPNNETNGLTFGGVGSGTTIDYVMSSWGGDDSFEWFGGTVNCKHLVAYAGWDDDFDTDFGFSGKVQFAVGIRDPFQADQSASNGFESDNDANGSTLTPLTSAIFANVTLLGPIFDSTKAISGNYGRAVHIRRNSNESIYNSVFVGFPTSVLVETGTNNAQLHFAPNPSPTAALSGNMIINLTKYDKTKSTALYGDATNTGLIYNAVGQGNDAPVVVNKTSQFGAALVAAGLATTMQIGYTPFAADVNFALGAGTLNSGVVTTPSGIDVVTYRGAFGATDWTDTWANFDPKNIVY